MAENEEKLLFMLEMFKRLGELVTPKWQPKVTNPDGHPTRCEECRFLCQKPRKDAKDKSYINCGLIPSAGVVQIEPDPNCLNFQPLKKKQYYKRLKRKHKNHHTKE